MALINLSARLFAFHNVEIKSAGGLKVGQRGSHGVGISKHRVGGDLSGAKVNSIATVCELLFTHAGALSVYKSDLTSTVYCEIDKIPFIVTESEICETGTPVKDIYSLIPWLMWQLIYGTNTELQTVFMNILFNYDVTKSVKADDVFALCDSFYYGCAKDAALNKKLITDAELEASLRSNAFEQEPFKGHTKYFGESERIKPTAKKKKMTSKAENSATQFLQDCKDGKYQVAYEWDEKIKGKVIPRKFLDKFVPTKEFEEIVKKIKYRTTKILERMDMGMTGAEAIGKDYLNIMLLGKPGTGKTTLAYAISAATGIPICTTVHNKHTEEDEYEGKTKIVDSQPTFVETDSLIFHELGGIDVCEEINLADPSVTMGGLGQKLEYPFIVKSNGYETKVRHPLNIVIGTMNVGTNGSNPLNQALTNRFKTPYILDDPTSETFIDILEKGSGADRKLCKWVYNAYNEVCEYLRSPEVSEEEICQNLSIRTCLGALENIEEGQTPIRALINSIIGAVAVVDLDVARRAQREAIEVLPDFK